MVKEAHFFVLGKVQSVGYRAWCVKTATQYALSGWVRNRADGSVEVFAKGEDLSVELFMKQCLKGPLWANVLSLKPATHSLLLPEYTDGIFTQKPSV